MRPQRKVSSVACVLCAVALAAAGALVGSEDYMKELPNYSTYECANCHASSQTVSGEDLNAFGVDFKSNAYKWNATLAAKDSDRDRFKNGLELGDDDGDGIPEIAAQRSNPGDPFSMPVAGLDETTWGILKSLFED